MLSRDSYHVGFGIYIKLKLHLAQCDNYHESLDSIDTLAWMFRCKEEDLKSIIKDFGLFKIKKNVFSCEDVREKMAKLDEKREQTRIAGIKSGEARRKKAEQEKEKQMNERSTDVQTCVEQEKVLSIGKKEYIEKRGEELEKEYPNAIVFVKYLKDSYAIDDTEMIDDTLSKIENLYKYNNGNEILTKFMQFEKSSDFDNTINKHGYLLGFYIWQTPKKDKHKGISRIGD